MRKIRALGLALSLLAGTAAAATTVDPAGNPDGRRLLDLYYGDVLFHYFQDDAFGALTRWMAARAQNRAEAHAQDGELLQGGLLLAFGQTDDALAVFQKLLQTETRPEPRNRAWLAVARTLHERGADSAALNALERIDAALPGDLEADRQMLAAEMLIDAGRYDEAAARLQAWKGSRDWMSYAQFNLGVALIRAGRSADGEAQLDQVDRGDISSEEQKALRDRANTALGFTRLQAQKWNEAREALRRVRLDGPSTNRALLGLGWAESGLGKDRDALLPWMELASRDPGDQAVQEALLAVPYAMARAGSANAATGHYQTAIETFEQQRQRLGALIAAINQPAFVERLLVPDDADTPPGATAAPARKLPDAPEYRALSSLIAGDAFQAGLRNCRELQLVQRNLEGWQRSIADPATPEHQALAPQSARIAALNAATAQLLQRQYRALQDQALAEIARRQQRLTEYQSEARFAQARLFDQSTSRNAAPAPKP
jgi:hypothetical protein